MKLLELQSVAMVVAMPRWASLAVLFALSHAVPEVYVNDDSSADGGSFTDCVGLIQEQDWKSAKKACKKEETN